ncbi:hypothetical protein SISSUDRAFT_1027961 [Sistotremastrum suecicum HHB10207 ss-3]|uniref:Nephrocystin 3-like N-terminal domain-containing protein n=1 Tax=Sistotremastrum suecicum HHB10207 ss-3 TaxID=1314776 RepID=A0A165YBJ2_9AGAM|nr:hypothetical protein SISSUDRAFT_1027961 [Sistotremastrum suecicum HHB10207 ss-3]
MIDNSLRHARRGGGKLMYGVYPVNMGEGEALHCPSSDEFTRVVLSSLNTSLVLTMPKSSKPKTPKSTVVFGNTFRTITSKLRSPSPVSVPRDSTSSIAEASSSWSIAPTHSGLIVDSTSHRDSSSRELSLVRSPAHSSFPDDVTSSFAQPLVYSGPISRNDEASNVVDSPSPSHPVVSPNPHSPDLQMAVSHTHMSPPSSPSYATGSSAQPLHSTMPDDLPRDNRDQQTYTSAPFYDISSRSRVRVTPNASYVWAGAKALLVMAKESTGWNSRLKSALADFAAWVEPFELPSSIRNELDQVWIKLQALGQIMVPYQVSSLSPALNARLDALAFTIETQTTILQQKFSVRHLRYIKEGSTDAVDILTSLRVVTDACEVYHLGAVIGLTITADQTYQTVAGLLQMARAKLDGEMLAKLARNLRPATSARFDAAQSNDSVSRRECTPNTREAILEELMSWSQDPDPSRPNIYWLNGMAGTGKTTVAYTFCRRLKEQNMLAGSFFCSRAIDECKQVNRILPTIVYALANYKVAPLLMPIVDVLEFDPDLADTANLQEFFERLILIPLQSVVQSRQTAPVIVVDALDECSDSQRVHTLLYAIFQHAVFLPFKLFITSRPETELVGYPRDQLHHLYFLHDVDQKIILDDITLYLNYELRQDSQLSQSIHGDVIASMEDIQILAQRAKNLFIYAATVVKYVKDPKARLARRRLRQLIDTDVHNPSRLSMAPLDALYTQILNDRCDGLDEYEQSVMTDILRTVVSVLVPLTARGISCLLNLMEDDTWDQLQSLRSVLYIPESDQNAKISPLHASFPDFITTSTRSHDFFLDPPTSHLRLAYQCLKIIMNSWENSPGHVSIRTSQSERLNIAEGLQYACLHWASHVAFCQNIEFIHGLCSQIDEFMDLHILHWVECLCHLGQLWVARDSLESIKGRISDSFPGLFSKIEDAHKFVEKNFEFISSYPDDLYRSALFWMPTTSSMWATYFVPIQHLLPRLVMGKQKGWDSYGMAVCGVDQPGISGANSVAISQDGTHVVSGSQGNTLRLWDATTGAEVQRMRGHTLPVLSVAYSPNGTHVVSGSLDNTVRIWDAATGVEKQKLEGHTSVVHSVAFSPDGAHVVSGSRDWTVRIWNVVTGAEVQRLGGHSSDVYSVAYSPDGTHVVSESCDYTARIWNAATGQQEQLYDDQTYKSDVYASILRGLTSPKYSVSGDKRWVVDSDETRKLWIPPAYNNAEIKDIIGSTLFITYGSNYWARYLMILDFSSVS